VKPSTRAINGARTQGATAITVGLDRAVVQTMTDVLIRMKANLLAESRDAPKASGELMMLSSRYEGGEFA